MNCRQCDTWNPDDKNFCWRCGAELPKPVEPKKKRAAATIGGLPIWMWLVIVLFFGALLLGQCFMTNLPMPA